MKINRLLFANKDYVLEDDVDFSNVEFDPYHIRKISSCHVKVTGNIVEDLLILTVKIKAEVIGVCSYTLEDVPLSLDFEDVIEISNEEDDASNDIFYEKNVTFNFDPYILSLVVSEVPLVIVKEGAKLPKNGDGYRVLSEDEYNEEQKNKKDSRWSKLDDIDV